MNYKKIFNKGYESKVTINIRSFLKLMYRDSKLDYEKIVYKVTPDYENKKLIIDFKHNKQE